MESCSLVDSTLILLEILETGYGTYLIRTKEFSSTFDETAAGIIRAREDRYVFSF